jgi:hypothetical protein
MSREPNELDALAYVGGRVAEYGAYAVIAICISLFWIGTPS